MITDEVPKGQRAYEACPQLHSGQVVWPAPEAPKPDTSASVLTPDTTLLPVTQGSTLSHSPCFATQCQDFQDFQEKQTQSTPATSGLCFMCGTSNLANGKCRLRS